MRYPTVPADDTNIPPTIRDALRSKATEQLQRSQQDIIERDSNTINNADPGALCCARSRSTSRNDLPDTDVERQHGAPDSTHDEHRENSLLLPNRVFSICPSKRTRDAAHDSGTLVRERVSSSCMLNNIDHRAPVRRKGVSLNRSRPISPNQTGNSNQYAMERTVGTHNGDDSPSQTPFTPTDVVGGGNGTDTDVIQSPIEVLNTVARSLNAQFDLCPSSSQPNSSPNEAHLSSDLGCSSALLNRSTQEKPSPASAAFIDWVDRESEDSDPDDLPFSQEHPEVRNPKHQSHSGSESGQCTDESRSENSVAADECDSEIENGDDNSLFLSHSRNAAQCAIEDQESGAFLDLVDDESEQDQIDETEQRGCDPEAGGEQITGTQQSRAAEVRQDTLPNGQPRNSSLLSEGNDRFPCGGLANWEYSSPYMELTISVDDVDKELESRYITEVSEIMRNVEAEMKGRIADMDFANRDENDVPFSRMDVLDVFLPQSLLEKLRASANRGLSRRGHKLVELEELKGIVIFHVLCATYGASPKTVASKEERGCFLQMGISAHRYKQVWSALNESKQKRVRVEHSTSCWSTRATLANALIGEFEQELAANNRRLLYVPNATIFSLDDDHSRMSSRMVPLLTNLSQINNPSKALGPICNGVCSALTSVFIAGHYSRPKEKLLEIWERLVQLIQGSPTRGSLLPMPDALFASDRAYNCAETIDFLSNTLGTSALGTHKRSLDFPFVFGEGRIRKKHKGRVVPEKGCRAIYSAKKKHGWGNHQRRVEACVYRESYSGRIAAAYTNNERRFSASKFTLVPRDAFRDGVDADRLRALSIIYQKEAGDLDNTSSSNSPTKMLCTMYESVKHLTYFQSEDPSWFLLRAFAFTSRTSTSFFRAVSKRYEISMGVLASLLRGQEFSTGERMPQDTTHVEAILRHSWDVVLSCTGMRKVNESEPAARHAVRDDILALDERTLNQMRKPDINNILVSVGKGQSASTRKGRLVEIALKLRDDIRNGAVEISEPPEPTAEELVQQRNGRLMKELQRAAISSWVMKPLVATNGMKEGSLNEEHVLRALPMFTKEARTAFSNRWNALGQYIQQSTDAIGSSLEILALQTVGLICMKTDNMFSDSPDVLCACEIKDTDMQRSVTCGAVEVKTMTSVITIDNARRIRDDRGDIIFVDDIGHSSVGDEIFHKVVPTSAYRVQCLHHATVLGVDTVLDVVAKGGSMTVGEVIYVAVLQFSPELMKSYAFCISSIRLPYFSWVGGPPTDIPESYKDLLDESYASDLHSLCSYYKLSMALRQAVSVGGKPLPPARMIRPKILTTWNAVKGGVDEYSRALKTYARTNVSENPLVSIIGRMISTQVANAGMVYQMFLAKETGRFNEDLDCLPCHHRGYFNMRHRVSQCQTAGGFVRRLAEEWIKEDNLLGASPLLNADRDIPDRRVMKSRFSRNAFLEFNKAKFRGLRLNANINHQKVVAQSAYCSLCGYTFTYRKHCLKVGSKQNKWCNICRQAICETCWEDWHSV